MKPITLLLAAGSLLLSAQGLSAQTDASRKKEYWNANTLLIPYRLPPAPAGYKPTYIDLDGDGDPDILRTVTANGIPVQWIDDDDDMQYGDLEGDTDNDGPGEDTDIVGVNQRVYRIVYYIHQQGVNNFSNTTWRSDLRLSGLQLQCGREHERREYPDQSCQECGDEIKHDNRLNGSIAVILLLEHSIHYQEEYKYRGYPFQCLDKEVTKNGGYRNKSRGKAGNTNTYNKTDCDLLDEGN